MSNTDHDKPKEGEVPTTGHSWDGIQELDNPMPRWWLWTFYACIAFAVVYAILYPSVPLIKGATPGLLGYSTRAEVAKDIQRFEEANADLVAKLVSVELDREVIREDPALDNFARNWGESVFNAYCVQCHGREGGGVQANGYPTLSDDDWLWGGALEEIYYTATHGIRNEDDPDARWSQMPAFGDDYLPEEEITAVVQYVRKISGQEHDAALASAGEEVFLYNCAACHMEDGTGDRYQGAPNLTDAIWLYGGDVETLTETVTYARFGIMPSHQERLTDAERRAVAVYVHQLGGGE
ncbi:cytochrome-c oxidase, cbb3-type subunit III [Rhodovulum adriaticum]|uniref:Cbb3-type cytochrome c oxidase subunit n=1 Tax=Rhodovulum adriaticum TaxID=35804 RepID=A0A4R2NZ90_RHOAD|nr:cytochrome-c oxidase, cbb3-type subunit III [Rhodovulum adriaticum]MBK1636104.1 cytochrome-c oxidase, cbb3-type subunit III [Rhodovulum adriaticum]TCP27487.1 cytochrome c oxidase cbb3-type subunit 3 [Rhodovulum adriaticum]